MYGLNRAHFIANAQVPSAFTFTAAGDLDNTSNTDVVLQAMSPVNSGAQFNIALGDLSYASPTPESAWCDYVKGKVGTDFPFELISGNHEDDGPAGNNIDGFTQCLPHRIDNISGTYGKEYYYDYPSPTPLARFILIAPNLTFDATGTYAYRLGDVHYNWVEQAIDSARAAGIKWIILGMHTDCISTGTKSCEVGNDLSNLLVSKKVDLVLHAHDHNYQRGKQLALNANCTSISTGSYNANCVIDDGSDNTYSKSAGTVDMIVGTGGGDLYSINTGDSENGYFARWAGSNINPSYGFLKVTVDDTQLAAQFVPAVGSFTDNFVISDTGIPTPSSPPSPTTTPIPPTPPPGGATISKQTTASTDDVEETVSSGSMYLNSSDLEFTYDGSIQTIGMRFNGIALPQGATISNAYIEFTAKETQPDTTNITFYGQAVDNPLTFTSTAFNVSSRPKTIAAVPWSNIPVWSVGAKYQTPTITSIVQELVARPGWVSGNSMAFIVTGTGHRTAYAYDGSASGAPKLVVTYSTGPTSIPTPSPTPDPNAPTATPTPLPTNTPVPSSTPLPTIAPPTSTLFPVADTYVANNSASSNYGTAQKLLIDGSPTLITYLKFDLASLAGKNITSAKLRVKVADNSSSGTQIIKSVVDTSWSETTMTYNNRPAVGNVLGSYASSSTNVWKEINVTPEVVSKRGFLMSLGIDETSTDGTNIFSRETADKPQLVITFN